MRSINWKRNIIILSVILIIAFKVYSMGKIYHAKDSKIRAIYVDNLGDKNTVWFKNQSDISLINSSIKSAFITFDKMRLNWEEGTWITMDTSYGYKLTYHIWFDSYGKAILANGPKRVYYIGEKKTDELKKLFNISESQNTGD